ncbi:PilN domain-containing protein [Rhodanobacter sp. AS-Z3]|uniref:PilN domain-containing protein n=1 Tax=Rhodanobacter sp. AS-Z3 TaxID=3031330 RepID=UPI002479E362|nr:PilN domain-containing protein [Rhodanobacter sp. AS-Z3]WEN16081.1 PilN domain-containing protein [Rhodanobacter sp. AS-Z3]
MAHVNLLPWRTERRKQREREFYMQLLAAFVVGLGALLVWMFWMDQRIDNQNDRNAYLQTEINQLDARIVKIHDLEKVREHLLARKQIIEQLQADRSQMVHLFDELVKTVPTSARLTALKQSGQSMSLDGVAQSNDSVAKYMRNLEASPWMGHTDLRKTENLHNATRMPYLFGLNVQLSKPKTDETEAGKAAPMLPAGNVAAPAKASTVAPAAQPAANASGASPATAPAAKGGA